MPKITVFGGFSSESEVDVCPGNSSSTSTEQPEKTENPQSLSTVPKTGKSSKRSKVVFTVDSAEESID